MGWKCDVLTTAKPLPATDFRRVAQVHLDTVEVVLTQREEPDHNFANSGGAMSPGPSSKGAG